MKVFENLFTQNLDKILVIGDIMLDNYVYGRCNRISPEAPVPVFEYIKETSMLGGAGNVVSNLLAFDAMCDILTVVGDDLEGKIITNLLKAKNIISLDGVLVEKTRKSTLKKRFIASSQQLLRLDSETTEDISEVVEDKIIFFLKKNIKKYKIILLSDYNKGVLTKKLCRKIIDLCRNDNVYVMVDPKGKDFYKYSNANLIKPNLKEFSIALDSNELTIDEIFEFSSKFKQEYNFENLVVTLAEKGIFYSGNESKIETTKSTKVYDVSGAGDTVFASIAICLNNKISLADSCKFANHAASIVIQKFGAETTTISDVIFKINENE